MRLASRLISRQNSGGRRNVGRVDASGVKLGTESLDMCAKLEPSVPLGVGRPLLIGKRLTRLLAPDVEHSRALERCIAFGTKRREIARALALSDELRLDPCRACGERAHFGAGIVECEGEAREIALTRGPFCLAPGTLGFERPSEALAFREPSRRRRVRCRAPRAWPRVVRARH